MMTGMTMTATETNNNLDAFDKRVETTIKRETPHHKSITNGQSPDCGGKTMFANPFSDDVHMSSVMNQTQNTKALNDDFT